MITDTEKSELDKYLPEGFAEEIGSYLISKNVQLTITKKRTTKLGDYQRPFGTRKYHKISVNGSLNKYAFLLTLLHEIAHLETYLKHNKKRILPHGTEWKNEFRASLVKLLARGILPNDLSIAIANYAKNPKASSTSDPVLSQTLKRYDSNPSVILSELDEHAIFSLGKRLFEKGKKRRTRFLCREISTNKFYVVSGLAEVELVDQTEKNND